MEPPLTTALTAALTCSVQWRWGPLYPWCPYGDPVVLGGICFNLVLDGGHPWVVVSELTIRGGLMPALHRHPARAPGFSFARMTSK